MALWRPVGSAEGSAGCGLSVYAASGLLVRGAKGFEGMLGKALAGADVCLGFCCG